MNTSITSEDVVELIRINSLIDELQQIADTNFAYGDLRVIREHLEDALEASLPEEAEAA